MAVRRVACSTWLEVDTVAKTLHLVIETHAAEGEGDVVVHRVDLTANLAGEANAEKRRKLRLVFANGV